MSTSIRQLYLHLLLDNHGNEAFHYDAQKEGQCVVHTSAEEFPLEVVIHPLNAVVSPGEQIAASSERGHPHLQCNTC